MLCEACNKNLATVFSNIVVADASQELYLCQSCLNKRNISYKTENEKTNEKQNLAACICGTSFAEIAESGYVNCKECYITFEKELEPIILNLHGNNLHKGKRKLSKLEVLQEKLKKAKQNNFISLANKIQAELNALKGEIYD